MNDHDAIDLTAWARRAFENEPPAGTVFEDLARGQAAMKRRRRWTAGTSALAVAAVAFAVALAPSLRDAVPSGDAARSDDGRTAPADGRHSQDQDRQPVLTAEDRALLAECERAPARPTDLTGWTVVDRVDDDWGTTAILLNDDETEWAECTVGVEAGLHIGEVRTPQQVPQGFVQQPNGEYVWRGGDDVSWAQQCIKKPAPTDCSRDLYFMTTRVPAGVDSITMETYDGTVTPAQITDGFALIRTFGPELNAYDGPLPGASDIRQPPIFLTYAAPNGDLLSRYDVEFLPPLPDSCDGGGGC